jgi:hypothetical protein
MTCGRCADVVGIDRKDLPCRQLDELLMDTWQFVSTNGMVPCGLDMGCHVAPMDWLLVHCKSLYGAERFEPATSVWAKPWQGWASQVTRGWYLQTIAQVLYLNLQKVKVEAERAGA